ncbi:Enterobactin exporter EntS [Lysinibacillus sphaericus]|uniref:Enterobactin exporter EntS n=1 Tax=Lysinibacillus sphaericus TaxID=1421 RepID=A0A2S5D1J0_LYSSH|nr:MFS transporter [Lysinibacillus sphaericus]POZ56946.1 Enterobactin exporter EntS [Lysinibacillus sphaericus]
MVVKSDSIWNNKQFLHLWLGNTIANLTLRTYSLVLPIYIYEKTKSSVYMSLMKAIEILPTILFGMLIGVIIDRYSKKNIMIFSILTQLLVLINIMYFINNSVMIVYILGFIFYLCIYIFRNSYHVTLKFIVSNDHLRSANAAISFMSIIVDIVGPSIAGMLIVYLGIKNSLLIPILGYLFLFINVLALKIPKAKSIKKSKSFKLDIKEGWQALVQNNRLWTITLIVMAFNFASSLIGGILIFYLLNDLSIYKGSIGLILAVLALGGVIASVFSGYIAKLFTQNEIFKYSITLATIAPFILFIFNSWYFLCIGIIIFEFAVAIFSINYLTLRQSSTPEHLLGRVTGTSSMLMKVTVPIAYLISGFLASNIEVKYIFLLVGLFLILVNLYIKISVRIY